MSFLLSAVLLFRSLLSQHTSFCLLYIPLYILLYGVTYGLLLVAVTCSFLCYALNFLSFFISTILYSHSYVSARLGNISKPAPTPAILHCYMTGKQGHAYTYSMYFTTTLYMHHQHRYDSSADQLNQTPPYFKVHTGTTIPSLK